MTRCYFTLLPVTLILLLAFQGTAAGQERNHTTTFGSSHRHFVTTVDFGVETGSNLSMFSQEITGVTGSDYSNIQGSGTGVGAYVAALADISLTPTVGLQLKLSYAAKAYGNSGTGASLAVITDENDLPAELREVPVEAGYSVSAAYIGISALARVNVTPTVSLLGGFTTERLAGKATVTSEARVLDSDYTFSDGTRTRKAEVETRDGIDHRLYALDLGAGYNILLEEGTVLTPTFTVRYFLNRAGDDGVGKDGTRWSNARLHNINIGAVVTFDM